MVARLPFLLVVLGLVAACWLAWDLLDPGASAEVDGDDPLTAAMAGPLRLPGEEVPGPRPQLHAGGRAPGALPRPSGLSPLAALVTSAAGPVAASTGGVPLHGRILDAQGRRASEVQVTFRRDGQDVTFTTDADGAFAQELPPGRYQVLLEGGRDGALYLPTFLVDGTLDALEWTLRPTASWVVVVEREGSGVGQVRVRARLLPGDEEDALFAREATTAFDGSVALADLPLGRYLIEAWPGDGLLLYQERTLKGDETVTLKTAGLVTFRGAVRAGEDDGPGVAGAALTLELAAARHAGTARVEGVSGPDGRFELQVPRGNVGSITVQADGFAPWPWAREDRASMRALRQLRGTEPVELTIVLRAGGGIAGRVLDADGRPVPGVEVEARLKRQTAPAGSSVSDGEGRYALGTLAPGDYDLAIATPGVLPAVEQKLRVRVPSDATAPVPFDVGIIASRRVTGTVTGADGAPALGAHVWLFGGGAVLRSARQAGRVLETWTDAAGRFALFDVPSDRGVTVRASLRDLQARPYHLPDNASGDGITLALAGTATLRGTVSDERTRQPIRGAIVYLRPTPVGGRNPLQARTDAEGRYELSSVLPGTWTILPAAGGYLGGTARTLTTVRDQELTQDLELDPGIVLEGRIVDEAGRPVRRARVTASNEQAEGPRAAGATARTGDDGTFRLTGLAWETTWRVRAWAAGRTTVTLGGFGRPDSRIHITLPQLVPPTR